MYINKKIFEIFTTLLIIIYAVYLCFINNYGWDWDTYAMFETFLNLKDEGIYSKSRGAGYLIPEIGFGFLAFFFGSAVTNLVTLIFLIIGLTFFYKAGINILNLKNDQKINIYLFISLCLSNHIILRDSTIPMDYSWSFMFYSIGLYALTIKKLQISFLFFALCFGSRFNFIAFIIPTIFFIDNKFLNLKEKILHILIVIFFGCLFYVPSWLQNQFSLSFIYSEQASFKTNSILSIEEISRFSYKVLKTYGIFSFLFILTLFIKFKKILFKERYFLLIIFFNFLVFFIFPWEPSFLWLSIISIFFIIAHRVNFKFIYVLIFLNLLNWLYQVEVISINYEVNNCLKKPISAIVKPHLSKGLILDTKNRLDQISCYPDLLGPNKKIMKYKNKIIFGKKFK